MAMIIRSETPADVDAIRRLTIAAFEPMRFSDGTEADALDRLRRDGDLTLSLVALEGDEISGHVAFSPAAIGKAREGWFGVGPVSVLPARQGVGIGSALMQAGLTRLSAQGANGCVLIGDPAFYGRFGFISDGALTYKDIPTRHVQWLAFEGDRPEGEVRFSDGLQD
ncbi:MAG: GNAT family N-acetyltransferase [Limimaricola soesokkakensis]|uniref:GNAT family N-acetyltransferase n=1 Tax=Limimaricola soesokkakensis TaxID=1343159 RepID=UPI0040595BA8